MSEIWKPIPSLPNHKISSHGRLMSPFGTIRKPSKDHTGSLTVTISRGTYTTNVRIARLVGEVFCKAYRPDRNPIYRNGDRSDCRPKNLKWVPQSKVTGAPYSKRPRPTISPARPDAANSPP
jgi:hypothetical protein